LGCFTFSGVLTALITGLVIAGVVYARGGLLYNPGPLNAQAGGVLGGVTSHAETGGQCEACHSAPWDSATMADLCVDCHGEIARQMRDMLALHGTLYQREPDLECRDCHPEHRGADAPLTVMHAGEFPHELLGFSLNGHRLTVRQEPFTCTDCHHEDISTFATDSCDACHRQMDAVFAQAHLLSFGAACLECHDGVDRFGERFDHNVLSFQLTGKHPEVACVQCHLDARNLMDFSSAPQDCYSCHRTDDPHETRFGADCAACHTTEGWEGATFDHDLSSFPLTGAHVNVDCEACHTNAQFAGLSSQCVACHADPDFHLGAFSASCADCHSTTAWLPASYDGPHTFPMDHEGAASDCQSCHPNNLTTYTCYGCHEHDEAEVRSEHLEEGISNFQDCMECHPDGREHEGDDD
jgi:hypothetical protein